MRRKLIGMTLGLALIGGLVAAPQSFAFESKIHECEVATEISYIKYSEDVMKEKGMMYGISGDYTYRGNLGKNISNIMLKIDNKVSFGQVDYEGELNDGTPYDIDDIDDLMYEVRGVGGYDFNVMDGTVRLTPYFGIGYRYLNDDSSNDAAGYERESNYFYSPLGIEAMTELKDGWSLGAAVEYDIFWFGKQKSHLGDAVASLSDIENDQKSGYGIRGSILVKKKSEKVNFLIEPFVKYWDINDSEATTVSLSGTIIGTAIEPENHSTEFGLKIGLEF